MRPTVLSFELLVLALTLSCAGRPPTGNSITLRCASAEATTSQVDQAHIRVSPNLLEVADDSVVVSPEEIGTLAARASATPAQLEALGVKSGTFQRSELSLVLKGLTANAEEDFLAREPPRGSAQTVAFTTPQVLKFTRDTFSETIQSQFHYAGEPEVFAEFTEVTQAAIRSGSATDSQKALFLISRAETIARQRQAVTELCRSWIREKLTETRANSVRITVSITSSRREPLGIGRRAYLNIGDARAIEFRWVAQMCIEDASACRVTFESSPDTDIPGVRSVEANVGMKLLVNGLEVAAELPAMYFEIVTAAGPEDEREGP